MTAHGGEDVELGEHSPTAAGSANLYIQYGSQCGYISEDGNRSIKLKDMCSEAGK